MQRLIITILFLFPCWSWAEPITVAREATQARNALSIDTPAIPQPTEQTEAEKTALILQSGLLLEQQQRWENALDVYEKAIRKYSKNVTLQKRFVQAKIRSNLHRRLMERNYLEQIAAMNDLQERDLLDSVLQKYETTYYTTLEPVDVFRRSIFALSVVLSDVDFREKVVQEVPAEQITAFQKRLRELSLSAKIASREELLQAMTNLATQCETELRANSAFFMLECLAGFVSSLDPYSTLLIPSQYTNIMREISGNYVGLGIEIRRENQAIWITHVVSGGPAIQAGILDGDALLAVDGTRTEELSTEQVSLLLHGEKGTNATLTLQTPGAEPRDVVVRRQPIVLPGITEKMILPNTDGIAYIQIRRFQDDTAKEMDRALWELFRQGMKKLIIDLRGNPGGVMQAAVTAADYFLSEGVIVSTRGNHAFDQGSTYTAKKTGTWRVPLVVLIDERSASASEIFAGAIRDHQRGTLIGTRSYGKGTVQSISPLENTGFGIKLTTALFFSPNGQKFHLAGVSPDFEVHQTRYPAAEMAAGTPNSSVRTASFTSVSSDLPQDSILQTALQWFTTP